MTTTLAKIKPGKKAKIIRINGSNVINRRLADMGVTRNTVVTVKRIAPLGDPVEIKVRGYNLSLRRHEADQILVNTPS